MRATFQEEKVQVAQWMECNFGGCLGDSSITYAIINYGKRIKILEDHNGIVFFFGGFTQWLLYNVVVR